jgi:hypothetical protein
VDFVERAQAREEALVNSFLVTKRALLLRRLNVEPFLKDFIQPPQRALLQPF